MKHYYALFLFLCIAFNGYAQESFQIDSLRLIGEMQVKPKTEIKGTIFGGISGIDQGENGQYYLISDDRSSFNPARFYQAEFFYDQHKFDSVRINKVIFLKDTNQQFFEKQTVDPEAIRYHNGLLYWTSEGDRTKNIAPFIRVADTLGTYIKDIPVNSLFQYYSHNRGLRENLALETCSFLTGTDQFWIVNEAPLYQDGPLTQLNATRSPIRLSFIDKQTGEIQQQYAYMLEPVAQRSTKPNGEESNSSPEILALSNHELLVLERGYTEGKGTTVRLFKVDLAGATNIKREKALAHTNYIPVKKQLLIEFNKLGLPHIDNIEGMTFGKQLENGNPSLIFVADDNFSEKEVTQYLIFEVLLKK